MKGKNSFRYNGLVHRKTVGVTVRNDTEGGKLVLTTRRQAGKKTTKKNFSYFGRNFYNYMISHFLVKVASSRQRA